MDRATRPPTPAALGPLSRLAEALRERLWFWPLALGVLAALAAEALVRLDRELLERDAQPAWVFSGSAEAARAVLSTVAASTMTVLGVTLTITLAVLALTAQGYSPRALRRFMRDRVIQWVIAGFVAAFVFALVALRLVREDEVPGITVTVAVLLSFVVLALLVWFFHHMASEIRVERLIHVIWDEARETIDRLPHSASEEGPRMPTGEAAGEARAGRSGRVRFIDLETMTDVARATAGTVVVAVAPGAFVAEGEPVARLHGTRRPDAGHETRLSGAVVLGTQRTMTQDVAFGLRQLVDIALRALSPGVNDSTTAEEALLRAADLMRRLADRGLGGRVVEEGRLLVVQPHPTWEELVGLAFDQVAAEAEGHADSATALVVLDALGRVMAATHDPERLAPLRARAQRVRDGVRRAVHEPSDAARVEAAAARLT